MSQPSAHAAVVEKLRRVLEQDGLVGGLRFLNSRTPHRFTGVYRYDGTMLRNVRLVDAFNPTHTAGVALFVDGMG